MLMKSGYAVIGAVICAVLLAACGGSGGSSGGASAPREAMLFGAREGADSRKVLWRSDGTASGTRRVSPGPAMSEPARFTTMQVLGDRHYFAAAGNAGAPLMLWASDGTETGTVIIESATDGRPVSPGSLTAAGDALYFTAMAGVGASDLWRTDSSPEGTYRIAGLDEVVPVGQSANPYSLVSIADQLLMLVDAGFSRRALVRLSSETEEVALLREYGRTDIGSLMRFGDQLILVEQSGTDYQLQKVDPHDGTTSTLLTLPGRGTTPAIRSRYLVGDWLYFIGIDSAHGDELWISDGTAAGTRLHADLEPGPNRSYLNAFHVMTDALIILQRNADDEQVIWAVEGELPPRQLLVRPLRSIGPVFLGSHQDSLYFWDPIDEQGNAQLCAITVSDASLRCLDERVSPASGYAVVPLNNELIFIGRSEGLGWEMWRAPFSLSRAEMVMDICPGDCSAF